MAGLKKKNSGTAFLHRLFKKHGEGSKGGEQNQVLESVSDEAYIEGLVSPCPYIRPLEHKLAPRYEKRAIVSGEPVMVRKVSSYFPQINYRSESPGILVGPHSNGDSLASQDGNEGVTSVQEVDTPRKRRRFEVINGELSNGVSHLETAKFDENLKDLAIEESGACFWDNDETRGDSVKERAKNQIEYVSGAAGTGILNASHWRYYLQCYARGEFNAINPPQPVESKDSFKYLPAVLPSNEAERLYSSAEFEKGWPNWAEQKAAVLIQSAMNRFATHYASLSTFDQCHEWFKAENGYNTPRVNRSISLAAHALFTAEVFVILDTEKDWRFKNSPLVVGEPKIRFFAAAPLLANDGQAVGIFAVFSREPRDQFTPFERRELSEFSHLVMKDLSQQAKWESDPDLRSTPILQRDSLINGVSHRTHERAPSYLDAPELHYDLFPPALNFHKAKPPHIDTQNFDQPAQMEVPDNHQDQTPPLSAGSGSCNSEPGPRELGEMNNEELAHLSLKDMMTPDLIDWHSPSPRPWSSSDITSLNINPPNTPVSSTLLEKKMQPYNFTVEDFMGMSDDDCHEEQNCNEQVHENYGDARMKNFSSKNVKDVGSTKGIPDIKSYIAYSRGHDQKPSPSTESNVQKLRLKSVKSYRDFPSAKGNGAIKPIVKPAPHQLKPSSSNIPRTSGSSGDPMADAAFTCASIAQTLKFDLIYVVELVGCRPVMTDEELFAPGGLEMRILVAHGMDHPLNLDASLHIRALRSRGCQFWENKQTTFKEGEYQDGRLFPIHTEEGLLRHRTSGIICGAFRKPSPLGIGQRCSETTDLRRLEEAVQGLKVILLNSKKKISHRQPKSRLPVYARYLTREASENKVSLRSRHH